jgi:1-aminocyclopropane-1-carboxylate deaminase/D-cysteine desulfhydrase-like pyridoxal-dependent ACC family enzyme
MILPDISKNYVQQISHSQLTDNEISLFILRLDLMNANWGGNKYFKLKYHIDDAIEKGYSTIGSFGGPWSNHLAALASFGIQNNISTIGKVRFTGDYKKYPTLVNAKKNGMQLLFLTNDEFEFENKNATFLLDKNTYWIPSGGHTKLGVKGCEEILKLLCLQKILPQVSHIIVPVGNGTTLAGISNSAKLSQQIIGVCAIKNGAYLNNKIKPYLIQSNVEYWLDYHFGGFGKSNKTLTDFMKFMNDELHLPTDKVYTAKMMYGIWDKIQTGYFKKGSILLGIHTGGLQGNG